MKNKSLLAVIFLAMPFVSWGQFLSEVVEVSLSTSTLPLSIVRTHLYDYTVSYGKPMNGNGYLVYSDHFHYSIGMLPPLPPRCLTLPSEIKSIRDIYVTNTHVHFCGESSNGLGLVGFMDIAGFSSSTATVYYVEVPNTKYLNHLVAYRNSKENQDVVAIGFVPNVGSKIIVEFNHILNRTGNYKYAILDDELLLDVKYTHQAGVVFLSHSTREPNLSIRKSVPESVVTSPVLNTQYLYSLPGWSVPPVSDAYLTDLAIAYTFSPPGEDSYTTQIRYINLSTMQMYRSQSYTKPDRTAPLAMAYIPALQGPVLIHDFYLNNTYNSNFVHLDPAQSSAYTARVLYHPQNHYGSITYFGGQFYAACGSNRLYYQDAYSAFPQSTQCIRVTSQSIISIESPNVTVQNNPVSTFSGRKKFENKKCSVNTERAALDCKNN